MLRVFHQRSAADEHVVVITGELCFYSSRLTGQVLDAVASSTPGLQLDLSGVTFADSAAVDMIERLCERGAQVTDASPAVVRVFELTGVDLSACLPSHARSTE